jgi:hypothetical protein
MQFRVRDDVQEALVHSHDKVAILLRGIDVVHAFVSSSVYQELVQQISQPLPDMAVFRLLQTIQGTAPFLVSDGDICRVTGFYTLHRLEGLNARRQSGWLTAEHPPSMSWLQVVPLLSRLVQAYEVRERQYRLTKFQFSLFEFAVHKACHDALTATHILPNFTKSWIRAGE